MKSSTKRVLSIGLSALFFIGILIVYSSLIRPEITEIGKKRSVAASKEFLFNNQKMAVDAVQKLIGQFQNSGQFEETVSLAVPRETNVTQALNQLQAIARNSQAVLTSFSAEPVAFEKSHEPLAKKLGVLDVDFSARGSYEAVKNLLASFETNVRIASVGHFDIGPVSTEKGRIGDTYSLRVKAEIYYQEN